MVKRKKCILTIGGSDSGGGAGIQADLRTIYELGEWGTCAVTCITAQNPMRITKIEPVSPSTVYQQIKALCGSFEIDAVKIGMLYSAEIVKNVITALRNQKIPYVVLDPLIKATSGTQLVKNDAMELICRKLVPLTTVLTPNIYEAEFLSGFLIYSEDDMKKSAVHICEKFRVACIVKGGHLKRQNERTLPHTSKKRMLPAVVDVLCDDGKIHVFSRRRLKFKKDFHGTGCVFSSALAVFLSRCRGNIVEATRLTEQYMGSVLQRESRK